MTEEYPRTDPVVVIVQPVISWGRSPTRGILIQMRGIEPHIGQWALPAGYIEPGESAEQAAIRELREEMSIQAYPGGRITKSYPIPGKLLIAVEMPAISDTEVNMRFKPSEECPAYSVTYGDHLLAFPIHNQIVDDALAPPKLQEHRAHRSELVRQSK